MRENCVGDTGGRDAMTCIHPSEEWQWVCEKCGHHVWAAIDDPTLDATDGAHPAWWRGDDHGFAKGVTAERERIAAAVRGLPHHGVCHDARGTRSIIRPCCRQCVLAIIEGREP